MKSSGSELGLSYDITSDFNPFTKWSFYAVPETVLICLSPNSFPGFSPRGRVGVNPGIYHSKDKVQTNLALRTPD